MLQVGDMEALIQVAKKTQSDCKRLLQSLFPNVSPLAVPDHSQAWGSKGPFCT